MNPIYFWAFENADPRLVALLFGVFVAAIVVGGIIALLEKLSTKSKDGE